MKPTQITFIFLFLTTAAFAQVQKPAQLILANQAILQGSVYYYDWEESPDFVEFRAAQEPAYRKYAIDEVQELLVLPDSVKYVSRLVKVLYPRQRVRSGEPRIITDSAYFFLKVLAQGQKAVLYRLIDKERNTHFFYQKPNQPIVELMHYVQEYYNSEGKLSIFENNAYVSQLENLLEESGAKPLKRPAYDTESMKAYFQDYNAQLSSSTVYTAKKERGSMNFYATAGFQYVAADPNYTGLCVGAGARFNLPLRNQATHVLVGLDRFPLLIIDRQNQAANRFSAVQVEGYFGSYLGENKVKPFFRVGLSVIFSPLDALFVIPTGSVGISYDKKWELGVRSYLNVVSIGEAPFFSLPRIGISRYF